jgi:hypothetical protein
MKRKLSPRPWHQAEQAHRRRKALGRAICQACRIGPKLMEARAKAYRAGRPLPQLRVPKIVRHHAAKLTRAALFGVH